MDIYEKEQYLIWVPLQTLILECWEGEERNEPSDFDGYTSSHYEGEDWYPCDIFAAICYKMFSSLRRRDVQRWPPVPILSNFILLAKKWGVVEAMNDRFRSPFIFGCSVWEAAYYMLSKAEPFRSELRDLRHAMSEILFAQIMMLHPWRPKPELPTPWHHYTEDDTTDFQFDERLRLRGGELVELDDGEELPQDLVIADRMDQGQTD